MNSVFRIAVFAASFAFFYLLVDLFTLSSIAKIKIMAEAEQYDRLAVYYSNGSNDGRFSQEQSIRSQNLESNEKILISLNLVNKIGRYIRIDPIQNEGSIKIYEIRILSHFAEPIVYDAARIAQNFRPSPDTHMMLEDGFVTISSDHPDPSIELIGPLKFTNHLFSIVLPLFLSVLTTIVVQNISLRNIYAISDITNKTPSTTSNITALDGLRGLAALMVLASHSAADFFGVIGTLGVWIFFCLSGFLLSIPFVKNPSLITSADYLQHYFFRRVKRILPMYYVMLTVLYLFQGKLEVFARHIVFIQGDSIFWTIPQEMFFYIVLPFVLLLNYYLCRGRIGLMIIATLAMVLFFNQNLLKDYLFIYGNHKKLPLYVGVFMTGVCISYFYHSPYARFISQRSLLFHNCIGVVLLLLVGLSSMMPLDILPNPRFFHLMNVKIYGFLAGLLLFFSVSKNQSILNRVMSWYPLRAVGIVGFSFYLVHPYVLIMLGTIHNRMVGGNLPPLVHLALALPITYFVAMITYSLIERPFIMSAKSKGNSGNPE